MYRSCLAVVLATAGLAVAAPVAVSNASFEDHAAGYWAAPEWSTSGDGNPVQEILASAVTGKDGTNFLQLSVEGGADGSPPTETGYQFSGELGTFQPNTTYTLTVALSHTYDWNPGDAMKAGIGLATGTTAGTIVGSSLFSMRNDGTTGDFVKYNEFADKSYALSTGDSDAFLGQPVRVALMFEHGGNYFRGARFDNVRLDVAAVPEPAFLGILGLTGLLAIRRRPNA